MYTLTQKGKKRNVPLQAVYPKFALSCILQFISLQLWCLQIYSYHILPVYKQTPYDFSICLTIIIIFSHNTYKKEEKQNFSNIVKFLLCGKSLFQAKKIKKEPWKSVHNFPMYLIFYNSFSTGVSKWKQIPQCPTLTLFFQKITMQLTAYLNGRP